MIDLIKNHQIKNKIKENHKILKVQSKLAENEKFIFDYNHKKFSILQTLLNNYTPDKILSISELLGIILGDGHITMNYTNSKYFCIISLNTEEKELIVHVRNLVKNVFNIEPSITQREFDNTTLISFYHKEHIEFLVYLEIIPGNKVKNQVKIPNWIKNTINRIPPSDTRIKLFYINLVKLCLKGLFDTDGSIYLNWNSKRKYASLGIKFTSGSENLVKDFKELIEYFGIKMSKVSQYNGLTKSGNKYSGYAISTESKSMVKRFLFEIIKPYKWQIKQSYIQERLNELGLTLKDVLTYKQNSLNNKEAIAIYFKTLFEELGTYGKVREFLVKKYKTHIKKETIATYIKKYLILKGKDYNKWLVLNSGIAIDVNVIGSMKIPMKIKSYVCKFIFKILTDDLLNVDDIDIMDALIFFIKNSELRRLDFLLNEKNTRDLVVKFLNSSVKLIRYFIDNVNDRQSPDRITNKIKQIYSIDLPYHHSQIKKLVNDLFK